LVGVLFVLPLVHDESIVNRNADDFIDTLLLQRRRQLVVPRNVRRRTGRGERTRQGEYDHGPVFEQFVTADIDPFVALAGFENYLRDFLTFEIT
jgi:hypothetical protein